MYLFTKRGISREPMVLVAGICGTIPAGLSVDGVAAGSIQLRPPERDRPSITAADMQLYLPALSTPCAGRVYTPFMSPKPFSQAAAPSLAFHPMGGVASGVFPGRPIAALFLAACLGKARSDSFTNACLDPWPGAACQVSLL